MRMNKKIICCIVIGVMIVCTACNKEQKRNVVWISEEFDVVDKELYPKIAVVSLVTITPEELQRSNEDVRQYGNILDGLVWKLKRYSEDKDKKYHVAIEYENYDTDTVTFTETFVTAEYIEKVNEKYGLNLNIDDWICFEEEIMDNKYYYYTFTAEEIFALSDSGICCYYIGSGEGNMEDIDYNTPEGIETYFELYGDGIVQYKKGMEVHSMWE